MTPLFPGQQPNEKIFRIIRPHWFVFAKQIAIWLIFVGILLLYDGYIAREFEILQRPEAVRVGNVVKDVYLMYLIGGLFAIWIMYYLNFQIVTNNRIVDVDQKNLLFHSTTQIHLAQIEDVTAEIKGVFGNLLNFGTVYVQTAGAKTMFEFDNVPDPNQVAKLILDLYERVPLAERTRDREDTP